MLGNVVWFILKIILNIFPNFFWIIRLFLLINLEIRFGGWMYLLIVKLLFNGSCCIGTSTVLIFYYFPIIIFCRVLFSCLSEALTDICVSHFPLNVYLGGEECDYFGGTVLWPSTELVIVLLWSPISIWLSYLHYSLVHRALSMEIVCTSWWFMAGECSIAFCFELAKKKLASIDFGWNFPSGNCLNLRWTSGGFVPADVLRYR
jgi:hypothetical protein